MKQHRADDDGPRHTTKRGKSSGSIGRRRGEEDDDEEEEEGGEGVAAVADEGAIRRAWEHYLNFVNSNDDDGDESENGEDGDEDGGDVDELLELIGILDPTSLPPPSSVSTLTSTTIPPPPSRAAYDDHDFHLGDDGASATKKYLVPVLLSMSHVHLASRAVSEAIIATVGGDVDASSSSSSSSPEFHFAWSLHHWPTNPVAHSLLANYRRMDHALSLECVCDAYGRAALCAHRWRMSALDFLGRRPSSTEEEEEEEEGGGIDANEWVELLIMNGALDVEYVGEDDDDDDDGGDEGDEEEDDDDDEGVEGGYSSSGVEATSSFMSAFLLSTLSKHDEALDHLRKFRLTHRVHPNVWTVASAGARPKPPSMSLDRRGVRRSHSSSSSPSPPSSAEFAPMIYCGWGSGDVDRLGGGGGGLPPELYRRLCDLFAPGAAYWKESDYDNRGYYSYFLPLNDRLCKNDPANVVEDVIVRHLLPIVERSYREKDVGSSKTSSSSSSRPQIVGAEWWVHTRPLGANLGHQLHFDTDECLLNREGRVTHPTISSVMYLTGAGRRDAGGDLSTAAAAGSTVVFDQTPESKEVAPGAWVSHPRDNAFMIFPGNLLHGVLPCIGGGGDDGGEEGIHRLTLMVGFWTRDVTEGMGERELYTTCGPMPPATSEHSWVVQARRGYGEDKSKLKNKDHQSGMRSDRRGGSLTYDVLPSTSPAWEEFSNDGTSNLTIPKGLDHRFFVLNAPRCFSESLYEKGDTL